MSSQSRRFIYRETDSNSDSSPLSCPQDRLHLVNISTSDLLLYNMGSAASKPATTTNPAQSTLTSERLDEKRSMAIQQTAHALARTHSSGTVSTVVPGLTMNKLDAWQSDFDAVSSRTASLSSRSNSNSCSYSCSHLFLSQCLAHLIEPNLEAFPTSPNQRRPKTIPHLPIASDRGPTGIQPRTQGGGSQGRQR